MTGWIWFEEEFVLAIHNEQLREHGGLAGIRDAGLLASAISKPQQLAAYGQPDVAALAGAYAFGVARNQLFLDGNKRTAFVLAESFLLMHGASLAATDEECYIAIYKMAAGDTNQEDFTDWLRSKTVPLS